MHARHILAEKGGDVYTVKPDHSLIDAAKILSEKKIGAALVVDDAGQAVGVFSERDLARVVANKAEQALKVLVRDVMSRDLVSASPATSIDELMTLMTNYRIRHIVIMDGSQLAGIVSIGDVVKRKIAAAEAEAESLKSYIEMA